MKRARFTEEQSISIPKRAGTGVRVADLRRRHGFSNATFYKGSSSFDVELTAPPASLDSPLSGGLPCRLKNFLPWALASRRPGKL